MVWEGRAEDKGKRERRRRMREKRSEVEGAIDGGFFFDFLE